MPVVLAERTGDTQELDLLCATGGAIELPRNDHRIAPDAERLRFEVEVPQTYTGYRAGYAVDGGEVAWLPTVRSGTAQTFEVEVDGQWENEQVRWRFFMEANVAEAEQDCYTGGGSGALVLRVSAE